MRKRILIPGLIILSIALVYHFMFPVIPKGLESRDLYNDMKLLYKDIEKDHFDSDKLINTYISKYYSNEVEYNAEKIEKLSDYDSILVDTAYLMLFSYDPPPSIRKLKKIIMKIFI